MGEQTASEESSESPTWRVSVGDLLATTAIVAVAVAPMRWMGGLFVLSAAASLLLLGTLSLLLYRRQSLAALAPCGFAAFVSLPLFSSGLFLQAVLSAFVCVGGRRFADRVRWRIGACVAAMLIAYAPSLSSAIERDREIVRLREAWPMVSIRDRLPAVDSAALLQPVTLTPDQSEALKRFDYPYSRRDLPTDLERLHSEAYRWFARAPGFGYYRMGPVTEHRLSRHDDERRATEHTTPLLVGPVVDGPASADVHATFQRLFLSPNRTGYAQGVDRVAGFVGHGIGDNLGDKHWVPGGRVELVALGEADPQGASSRDDARWVINRLELIGLVLHDEPIAYVSEKLPNMNELRDAPTRDLDAFEAAAVERLRGQEDVVIERSAETRNVRMVGALRAGESCTTCHAVGRGALLGAFSYEMVDRVTVIQLR